MEITCPECGAPSVPLLYGKPTPEGIAAAGRGELVMAGCALESDSPDRTCGLHRFRHAAPPMPRKVGHLLARLLG